MMKKICLVIAAVLVCTFLFLKISQAAQDTLTISRVSDDPRKHYKRLKPFINYLARKLRAEGIKKGRVLLAKDNHQLIEYLRDGEVDIVTETPYATVILHMEKADTIPLLRRWKGSAVSYSSYIFVRKDSAINSLKDLADKVIAFEDPGSTSGYFLPKVSIIREGLQMVELKNHKQKPPAGQVGYCFAGGESNIVYWVHKGRVDAGALSNLEFRELAEVSSGLLVDLRVIYESELVPRNILSVRSGMDPKLIQALKDVLLNMENTEEGRKVMWKIAKTTAFDQFPQGIDAAMEQFRKTYELLKEEINREYPE